MAAIDELTNTTLDNTVFEWRKVISILFWLWFDQHSHDIVIQQKRLWFFTLTIEIKDLEFVFKQLFGSKPI